MLLLGFFTVYLIVGVALASLLDEQEDTSDLFCIVVWPLVLVIGFFCAFITLMLWSVDMLRAKRKGTTNDEGQTLDVRV